MTNDTLFAIYALCAILLGCTSPPLQEGAPTAPPTGVESLCENNPDACQ